MNPRITSIAAAVRGLWRDRRGVSAVVFAASSVGILGMAALALDVGLVMAARSALQANTNAAVLAATNNWTASGGTAATAKTIAEGWHNTNAVPNVTITSASATTSCVTATTGLPSCNVTSPNVVSLTQTGTVATRFFPVVGLGDFTISAKSAAAIAGGSSTPLNVMFVLDATASMNSTADTQCTVPHVTSPTKFQCALYGIQQVMKQMIAPVDQLGIMVFPGMASTFVPCAKTYPASVPYGSSTIFYQINSASALSIDYNDGKGSLYNTSALVMAAGDNANSVSGCIQSKGGEGTYYAEVLTKAQAALVAQGNAKSQNVIILLSDGDATASGSQTKLSTTAECGQAVTAATAIKTAGTWIYSIAYDAPTSGCTSGDTYNPCTAMEAIASSPSKFFSATSTGTAACTWASSPNSYSNVATAFQQVSTSLSKPRLILAP